MDENFPPSLRPRYAAALRLKSVVDDITIQLSPYLHTTAKGEPEWVARKLTQSQVDELWLAMGQFTDVVSEVDPTGGGL